jgi:hypothetical protein
MESYSKEYGVPPLLFCLNEFGGTCLGSRTHTRTLESTSFSPMSPLGMSHMTYCRDTKDTKTAVRKKVKKTKIIII